MSSLIKNTAFGLVGIGVGAGLYVQQTQLRALRAELTALQNAATQTAAVPVKAAPVHDAAGLRDTERLELLRLRGEVAGFRKQRAQQLAASRTMDPTPPQLASPEPASAMDHVLNKPALRERMEAMKTVGLALRNLATEEHPEARDLKFTPGGPQPQPLLKALGGGAGTLDQIELLVPDMASVLRAAQYPEAIIARSREALPTDDGRFVRTYALGDGSVQFAYHVGADDALAWGQSLDGHPVPWEVNGQTASEESTASEIQQSGLRRMDPVLARRYGLIVSQEGEPAATGSSESAPATRPPFRMDPVLAKRYGLFVPPTPAP